MNKKLLRLGVILSSVAYLGISVAYLFKKNRYLRDDVNYQLVERVHERLANSLKQLFQEYDREETRRNIYKAIQHVDGWEYFCDSDGMATKILVSIDLLNYCIVDDPEGKMAYIECRDILHECLDLINECSPKPDESDQLFDRIYDFLRGRKGKSFKGMMDEFSERLEPDWYELTDEGIETALRPIYPWDSEWYPEDYAHRRIEEFTKEDNNE